MSNLPEIVSLERPQTGLRFDEALEKAKAHFNSPIQLTGGSGYGWSKERTLQECPRKFYLKYINPPPPDPRGEKSKPALDIGSCYHAYHAFLGQRLIDIDAGRDRPHARPTELRDFLYDVGADPEVVQEAWRVFRAWVSYYEDDYIDQVFAVEYHVEDPEDVDTARYDRIISIAEGTHFFPGTWIHELKTSARMDDTVKEGWHLDGEIIKQLYLWHRCGLDEEFGPLQGAIVDVVTKAKEPKFHREIVCPPWKHVALLIDDMRRHRSLKQVYKAFGRWPANLSSCRGRFGACGFFHHCRTSVK